MRVRISSLDWLARRGFTMGMLELIVLLIVVLLLIGALPVYPYSRSWGFYPSGGLATLLVVVLILLLLF